MPEPTSDGRTGRVPAGCVFWFEARDNTFTTVAEDHGNCSVGSLTHGFKTLEEAATGADVAALVESEWVTPDVFPHIPTVTEMDPSRKSGGALHRLHCFCLEFDGACEVQRRVPTDWIIEPIDVSGYGSFSLAS